jgi:hypothetical protein
MTKRDFLNFKNQLIKSLISKGNAAVANVLYKLELASSEDLHAPTMPVVLYDAYDSILYLHPDLIEDPKNFELAEIVVKHELAFQTLGIKCGQDGPSKADIKAVNSTLSKSELSKVRNLKLGGVDYSLAEECKSKSLTEAINSVSELEAKLRPLSELEIFKFMHGLRPGTFFNMGMYSMIPVASAYKDSIFIYKVINMTAIVSGVDYENIGTTKDFRDRTGKGAGGAWYDHMPGYEHKVGVKKSDQASKYVLWDIKDSSDNWVRFYLVDSDANTIKPVSKLDLETCPYLTPGTKSKLSAGEKSKGVDKVTGQVIENQTNWRTAAFTHIFWLSQNGAKTSEYGARFVEGKANMNKQNLKEAGSPVFRDLHADIHTDLDAFFNGSIDEKLKEDAQNSKQLYIATDLNGGDVLDYTWATSKEEAYDYFYNREPYISDWDDLYVETAEEAGYTPEEIKDLFDIEQTNDSESACKKLSMKESYRRTVARGKEFIDNELFVDFD